MSIIDKAKKHFKDQERREIEVPEWSDGEGAQLTIYAKPTTVNDRNFALTRAGGKTDLAFLVYLIIRMAEDKDGNKLFTIEDKRDLMFAVDGAVVTRIGNKILGSASVEDMEKNFKETRS